MVDAAMMLGTFNNEDLLCRLPRELGVPPQTVLTPAKVKSSQMTEIRFQQHISCTDGRIP
jgi:hypothetical protein